MADLNGMRFITGSGVPAGRIGQGTWMLGEDPGNEAMEEKAVRTGIEHGLTLLDTAEMYGEGLSEAFLGRVIHGLDRDRLYLVSKVYPHNAGRDAIFRSCEASLRRLGVDRLDLYLLHWRGTVPLSETVECMEELKRKGRIREWGVSNFDLSDMEELSRIPGGDRCAADQVMYHLGSRGIEYDLLPYLQEREIGVMAYCPLARGGVFRLSLMSSPELQKIAAAHHATVPQILLAFLLTKPGVVPIPRAADPRHAEENAEAMDILLSEDELKLLDRVYPAPDHKVDLETD